MQGIDPCGQTGVVAIHGQGVLRQIVGADGQEVRVFGQLFGLQRGGRDFDHHADFRSLSNVQFQAQGIDALADVQQFVDFGDHRQQDSATAQRGHLQQCTQLLIENFRTRLSQSNTAQAEHRIGLGRQRQVVELLVAAHIDGADDHRVITHRVEHGLIGDALFLDVRCGVAINEQKLGAQQADTVGTVGKGIRRLTA
jgi:hypothetical protein